MAGWFDSLAYKLSPLLGNIGKGIADNFQDSRMTDAVRAYQSAPDLDTFRNISTPDDIYSPEHLKALELMKSLRQKDLMDQRDLLQKQAAAPVAQFVAGLKASGNDADPNFTGDEWVKGMATTPALGGFMSENEYNNARAGVLPGLKKGSAPVSSFVSNPEVAQLLSNAELAAQNKGSMARTFTNGAGSNPMDLATLATNTDLANGFDKVMQGTNNLFKQSEKTRDDANKASALNAYLNTPAFRTPESANSFITTVLKAGGYDAAKPLLERFVSMNEGIPVGDKVTDIVRNGPNSTVKQYATDMWKRPIAATAATSTNNPSDRELGLITVGEGGGSGKRKAPQLYVIQKPDGKTVQIDAATEDGRYRLDMAIADGERISKLGTQSVTTTDIDENGNRIAKKITGPTVFGVQTQPKAAPPAQAVVNVTRDKSGKLVIKR